MKYKQKDTLHLTTEELQPLWYIYTSLQKLCQQLKSSDPIFYYSHENMIILIVVAEQFSGGEYYAYA